MKFKKVNIATARIKGLKKEPYFLDNWFWGWEIVFSDFSTLGISNFLLDHALIIDVGDTEEEGKVTCNQIRENFKNSHIKNGDRIALLYESNGSIIAIGNLAEDSWIDVQDNFVKKTFKELNIIIISSLKVH